MRLSELLKDISFEGTFDDVEIESLSHDSRVAMKNGLFFAIDGTRVNGAGFIDEAIKNGAVAVITSEKIERKAAAIIKVEDPREAMSKVAAAFYNYPSKDMLILSVTGTNGKTTTTYMLASVLSEAGYKVGIIGTNGVVLNGVKTEINMTTPDPIVLMQILAHFREEKVTAVCMEVSAHALKLRKVCGIMTDIALFTNLTQDHLDFFSDMESYGKAKAMLFKPDMARQAVFNFDDDFGKKLFFDCDLPSLTYSREKINPNFKDANIIATNETHNISSQQFRVETPLGDFELCLKLNGGFNVSNALGVVSASLLIGIDLEIIKRGLEKLEGVDGRFMSLDVGGIRVVIDYAHTPDGLENILASAREITSGRLISVFGCGGNRDKTKREIMGEISSRLADYTIVTSDNPRFERPEDIAVDIIRGIKSPFSVELDRKKAISLAISLAKGGDTVVIAGKGAEPYIDMLGVKTPYEDREVVEEIIKKINR